MMNIWSLFKHNSIKLLLLKLQTHLQDKSICIENVDDKDFFSVTLVKPDQPGIRAYIYTYSQARDLYGIHLEYPMFHENDFNNTIQIYEDLSINQIINTLEEHFDVAAYEMAV